MCLQRARVCCNISPSRTFGIERDLSFCLRSGDLTIRILTGDKDGGCDDDAKGSRASEQEEGALRPFVHHQMRLLGLAMFEFIKTTYHYCKVDGFY